MVMDVSREMYMLNEVTRREYRKKLRGKMVGTIIEVNLC